MLVNEIEGKCLLLHNYGQNNSKQKLYDLLGKIAFSVGLLFTCLFGNVAYAQGNGNQRPDTSKIERSENEFLCLGRGGNLDSAQYSILLAQLQASTNRKIKKDKKLIFINLNAIKTGSCNVTNCQTDECKKAWVKQFAKRAGAKLRDNVFIINTRHVMGLDTITTRLGLPVYQMPFSLLFRFFYKYADPYCEAVVIINEDHRFFYFYGMSNNYADKLQQSSLDQIFQFYKLSMQRAEK